MYLIVILSQKDMIYFKPCSIPFQLDVGRVSKLAVLFGLLVYDEQSKLFGGQGTVKSMNDSDIDALGVRVLDSFCADLAPSHPETEEDECSISPWGSNHVDSQAVRSTELVCVDRVEAQNKPKRKWNRKIYPASAVHKSARI